jgi:hypothetical protein
MSRGALRIVAAVMGFALLPISGTAAAPRQAPRKAARDLKKVADKPQKTSDGVELVGFRPIVRRPKVKASGKTAVDTAGSVGGPGESKPAPQGG